MENMSHIDSMTVIGSHSPPSSFSHYFQNEMNNVSDDQYEDMHKNTWVTDYYDRLKEADYYDSFHKEPPQKEFHDYQDQVQSPPELPVLKYEPPISPQEIIEDKIVILREELSNIEKSYEWKFLNNPEQYPCTYQWKFYSSELNITATLKLNTKQDRDRILSNNFSGNIPGIPRVDFFNVEPFYKAVNQRVEIEARNHLLAFKARHQNTLNEIQSNINELNKLRIARSSVLAIPTPSVPTLSYRAGSNSQVTQTANSDLAKGIENTLGNIRDGLTETFDCSFGMSCSNDIDQANKDPNVGKELTAEEKEAIGISGGSTAGTPNGFEPDDERFKQQEVQTTHRKNEIKELFEYDNSRSGIIIGNRTLIEMPNKGNAKIFSGASEAEIKQYFIELTGNKSLPAVRAVPGKGNIYTVKTPNGSFNLRDFSNSASETGKAWTIDIPRGIAKDAAPVEIKFLK